MRANNLIRFCSLSILTLAALLSQGWAQDPKSVVKPSQSATLLPDGQVLLLGGTDGSGSPLADAYLLDASNNLKKVGGMLVPRAGHTATVLPNGRVLIFGGIGPRGELVDQTEMFDPATQSFSALAGTRLLPRAYHTATLLTDGRLLIVGGVQLGGAFPDDVQLWNWKDNRALSHSAALLMPREGHTASLLADGAVRISGGTDRLGRPVQTDEFYDPVLKRFRFASQVSETAADAVLQIAASIPGDGAADVPVSDPIAFRFTRLLSVSTVTEGAFVLTAADGSLVKTKVTPAERGRLVFIVPDAALQPGATYTVSISGVGDSDGNAISQTAITFQTAGEPRATTSSDWVPGPTWTDTESITRFQLMPPLEARPGVTALSGQVLKLNGWPLEHVTLEVDGKKTQSDETGRFLLQGLSAGRHVLWIDATTANRPEASYGVYEAAVVLLPNQTNVLNYTIWMTRLDTAHAVEIPSPTTKETVITNPMMPGLELHLPPNTVIKDRRGRIVRQISITPIPLNKPPFPLPAGLQVPIYFTIQPGGAYINVLGSGAGPRGARLIYPNGFHLSPGTPFEFWNYDADVKGWYVYGEGRVAPDALSIIPDPGVAIYEFTGAMTTNPTAGGGQANNAGQQVLVNDPVSLATGQLVYTKTDLALPDVVPIAFTRTYISNDSHSRAFGIGANHSYDFFMVGDQNPWTYQELILPDGARIRFDRISPGTSYSDAVYAHATSGTAFYGARLFWNGDSTLPGPWTLKLTDGTTFYFANASSSTSSFASTPLQIVDRHGNKLTITRDASGHLAKIASPNGRYISVTNDSSGRITGLQDNGGRTVGYTYDATGRLSTVTDAGGGVTTYTYDAQNRMLTIQDARGIVYLTNQYDSSGRVVQQTNADGGTYLYSWTAGASSTQAHFYAFTGSSGGGGTAFIQSGCWNGSGVNRADPTCIEGYMPPVAQVDVTDPRGYVRRVAFNSAGYMTSDTHALGQPEEQTVSYAYFADNLLQSVTDALGRQTTYDYDGGGKLIRVTGLAGTPNAVASTFAYGGPFAKISSVTDPLGHTSTFTYDSLGNLTTTTDPLNHSTTFAYNGAGQLTSVTDALNTSVQFGYFGGDPVSVTDPLGNTATSFYDSVGRVVSATDALGNTAKTQYSPLNLVTQVTDAKGNTTSFSYDPNGNLLSLTDATLNHTTSWTYDNMDRVATRTDPLNRQASYTYDLNGNLASRADRKNLVTSFTYDPLDRPKLIGYNTVINGGNTTYESTTSLAYDAGSRLTQAVDSSGGTITKAYNSLNRLTTETTPQGSITYGYDNSGRRTSMTVAGQPQVTYSYDNANRLTGITQGLSTVGFSYDNVNRRSSLTLPNGVSVSYGYDNDSRMTGITYNFGGNTLGNLSYSYDQLGRRTQVGGSFARTSLPGAVTSAVYDAANQLTNWNGTTISYDANGNMLSDGSNSFTWNARNQVATLNGVSLQYDASGRRIKNAAGTSFLFDGPNAPQELSGSTVTANTLTGWTDEAFQRSDSNGTVSPLTDALGSTIALVDPNGNIQTTYSYDPFGNTTSAGVASSNASQYTGRENEGNGLYYYRARYYSPVLHRFVSQDPLAYMGGLNVYSYAGNSPTNVRDPSGKCVVMGLLNTIPFNIKVIYQSIAGRKAMYYSGWEGTARVLAGNAKEFAMGCALGVAGKVLAAAETAEVATVVEEEVTEESTTEALQEMVDEAAERFEQEGFTEAQERALLNNPDLEPAFTGERIDFYAREIAQETGLPEGIQMTPRGQFGPDFLNPATGQWWDITTGGQWASHVAKYGAGGTILIY